MRISILSTQHSNQHLICVRVHMMATNFFVNAYCNSVTFHLLIADSYKAALETIKHLPLVHRTKCMIFFFTSWYRHSGLFRLHILIPSFPKSTLVTVYFWSILQPIWVSFHLPFYPNVLSDFVCVQLFYFVLTVFLVLS
jgi:hypothetical protein